MFVITSVDMSKPLDINLYIEYLGLGTELGFFNFPLKEGGAPCHTQDTI